MHDTRAHDSAPPRRLMPLIGFGLAVGLAVAACAGDSASDEWTFTPVADAEMPTPDGQVASIAPVAATAPADEFETGRAQPLEPPAGNVIPRFVEPERADPPAAAEAEPAPLDVDPQALLSETPAAVELTLVAQGNTFDADELTVSAGSTVRLTLRNEDPVRHNFALYRTDAAEESLFVGEAFTGPGTARTYEFTAPDEPGQYFFRCDIHPQLITGTFTVE